tara:strand:- start:545 stop:1798 length:1254 start_codon:yes stop_codon:yes gene_type:complete
MNSRNIIVIGSNELYEYGDYVKLYKNGLFIEAIPDVSKKLEKNINICNETHNTNYIAINALVTEEENKKYPFYVFSNKGESSSIYEPNKENWIWDDVRVTNKIELISTTMNKLIEKYDWGSKKFDVVLDVQGCELNVLKGFTKYLKNIENLKVEISKKEFYIGGVLFDDLDKYLNQHNFKLKWKQNESSHCDVLYVKKTNNFKSQIGQDVYVLNNIFGKKKNGFFIELGGADGITHSNTYAMEKDYNWGGICIEPNPKFKEELEKNRSCHKVFVPVYSSSNKMVNFSIVDYGQFSGISNHLGNIGNSKVEKKVKLRTKTLTQICDECNAPKYIDYLSLDTEGTELEILKGFDFKKYTIGYISVEHNYRPLRQHIRTFLESKGFIYARWNRFDDEYMHKSIANKYAWSNLNQDPSPNI